MIGKDAVKSEGVCPHLFSALEFCFIIMCTFICVSGCFSHCNTLFSPHSNVSLNASRIYSLRICTVYEHLHVCFSVFGPFSDINIVFLHIGMFLSLLRIFSLHFHSRSHVIVTAFTFSLLICDFFSAHAHVFLQIPHCCTFAIFYVSPSFSSSSCFFACERFLTTTAHLHVFYFLCACAFFSLFHVFSLHFHRFGIILRMRAFWTFSH
jgi:hypothetical protein